MISTGTMKPQRKTLFLLVLSTCLGITLAGTYKKPRGEDHEWVSNHNSITDERKKELNNELIKLIKGLSLDTTKGVDGNLISRYDQKQYLINRVLHWKECDLLMQYLRRAHHFTIGDWLEPRSTCPHSRCRPEYRVRVVSISRDSLMKPKKGGKIRFTFWKISKDKVEQIQRSKTKKIVENETVDIQRQYWGDYKKVSLSEAKKYEKEYQKYENQQKLEDKLRSSMKRKRITKVLYRSDIRRRLTTVDSSKEGSIDV